DDEKITDLVAPSSADSAEQLSARRNAHVERAHAMNIPCTPRSLAKRAIRTAALLATLPLLGGCQVALLDPMGPIAAQEKSIIILATCLMLVVVVPVIPLTILFAWRYRASNTAAKFMPDWEHSTRIELVVWLVPCLIIAVLGTVTWVSTHQLDPYRPIAAANKPVEVEV